MDDLEVKKVELKKRSQIGAWLNEVLLSDLCWLRVKQ